VTEHQAWQPIADGTCACAFTVDFSAPLVFTGTAAMSFDGTRTTVITEGEFKAAVPLFGGKVERLALAIAVVLPLPRNPPRMWRSIDTLPLVRVEKVPCRVTNRR